METLEAEPWNFKNLDVIILTEADYKTVSFIDEYCHTKGKKFILANLQGVFGRIFCDFGPSITVVDKNGEQLQDSMLKSISNEEEGLVELLANTKHSYEDGDEVLITEVKGMMLKEGEKHADESLKSDSINGTIHKVKVINPSSFRIGDTRKFTPYQGNGIAKQLKSKFEMKFKKFDEVMTKSAAELKLEDNLAFADFTKFENNNLSHVAFEALDAFNAKKCQDDKAPQGFVKVRPWNREDAEEFIELAKVVADRYDLKPGEWKDDGFERKFLYLFAFQACGVFNPLAAFYGGFVAQECVKAIT